LWDTAGQWYSLGITLYDKACQWHLAGQWYSLGITLYDKVCQWYLANITDKIYHIK
jgi:hypothetical protein